MIIQDKFSYSLMPASEPAVAEPVEVSKHPTPNTKHPTYNQSTRIKAPLVSNRIACPDRCRD